jgi:hypothetical protein
MHIKIAVLIQSESVLPYMCGLYSHEVLFEVSPTPVWRIEVEETKRYESTYTNRTTRVD